MARPLGDSGFNVALQPDTGEIHSETDAAQVEGRHHGTLGQLSHIAWAGSAIMEGDELNEGESGILHAADRAVTPGSVSECEEATSHYARCCEAMHAASGASRRALILGWAALAVGLAASQCPDVEHASFITCDVLIVLAVAVYTGLRWTHCIRRDSLPIFCAIVLWLVALLINLASPSRRRQLLELEDDSAMTEQPCEAGAMALWIAFLLVAVFVVLDEDALGATAVNIQVRSHGEDNVNSHLFHPLASGAVFGLLGQLVSLQHLIVGLLLPQPECDEQAEGAGGLSLGLSPLWASSVQLSLFSFLLWSGGRRLIWLRHAEQLVAERLKGMRFPSLSLRNHAENRLERVVAAVEAEVRSHHELMEELCDYGFIQHSGWSALADHLAETLSSCCAQLKCSVTELEDEQLRESAMDATRSQHNNMCGSDAVSKWLAQDWTAAGLLRSSTAGEVETNLRRHGSMTMTDPGLKAKIKLGEWDFNAIEIEAEHQHVLQVAGFELLHDCHVLPSEHLCGFLERLERSYLSENAYHSHIHAADMCNSFFFLATKSELWTSGGVTPAMRAAGIIAALGHDVGHFGRNNLFLISSRHRLAVVYNDRSVLECYHSATLIQLLDEEYSDSSGNRMKLLSEWNSEQVQKARQLMISLILGTDTQKHLEDLAAFRLRMGAESFNPLTEPADQQQSLALLFRAADIGHSAKAWALHEEWSKRVVTEFHQQGDQEKEMGLKVSPLCEREGFALCSSQVGFLQFICLPTWREVSRFEDIVAEERSGAADLATKRRSTRTGRRHSNVGAMLGIPASRMTSKGGSVRRASFSSDRGLGSTISNVNRRENRTYSLTSANNAKIRSESSDRKGGGPEPGASDADMSGIPAVERHTKRATTLDNGDTARRQQRNNSLNPVKSTPVQGEGRALTSPDESAAGRLGESQPGPRTPIASPRQLQVPGGSRRRWLTELCLEQCEKNCETWKELAAPEESAGSVPSRAGSRKDTNDSGAIERVGSRAKSDASKQSMDETLDSTLESCTQEVPFRPTSSDVTDNRAGSNQITAEDERIACGKASSMPD